MKVPFSLLKQYLEGDLNLNKIADALTMAGLEVDSITEYEDDYVIELEITPNRADCLSILGIARELRAIFGFTLKKPSFSIEKEFKDDKFKITIINPELCYRYAGRIVRNVKVAPSPEWLKDALQKAGIRSINNVVDVTNYVLIEYGHPLHAFDLDLIEGYCIKVGTPLSVSNKQEEEITTLDGVSRKVSADTLLIWDGVKPIAIAGVMGGANTEVTENTKNILIESAYFKPESVRRTSKKLSLSTEASYRFERGTDIENLKEALDRAAYLIQQLAGGEIYEAIDEYPVKISEKQIVFNIDRICKFIGIKLPENEILKILHSLDIEVVKKDGQFIAKVPSHRLDLSIEEDIAEEVARIYGYDKVPATLPECFKPAQENLEIAKKRKFLSFIRDALIATGYNEAVNFSFMSPEDLDILEIADGDERRRFVSLLNPLRQEESVMRTMLCPVLIKNVLSNSLHGIDNLKLFEIAKVYIKNSEKLPTEPLHLGLITKKEEIKSPFKEDPYDFYAVKGFIEGIGRYFKVSNLKFVKSTEPFLHPGQSADIFVKDNKIGFIGVLSPKIISKLDFKTKPYICVAEIDLDKLFALAEFIKPYKAFSDFPSVKRDVSMLVDFNFEVQRIFEIVNAFPSDLIEDVSVFDVFYGKTIPEGKKSIAFSIIYQAKDRTLTADEVDKLHSQIINKIVTETGAVLRV